MYAYLGAISVGNIGIAMMEPSLPIWMMSTMRATEFEQGFLWQLIEKQEKIRF